jgi:hypothetical protein
VIFHSVWRFDEETNRRVRLQPRDYWNIAGRAGRAGEETEGTIIHIVQNDVDRSDYEYYKAARNAIDPVISALYQMLEDLVRERTSADAVASKLDAELLALLVEESDTALTTSVIEDIVDSSLAAVQAKRAELPTALLVNSLAFGAARIAQLVPDARTRRIFSSTGLRSTSCTAIAEHVNTHRDLLTRILNPMVMKTLPT